MNNHRINNYRMGAYAALAVGLINMRYQTGAESNVSKSLALVIPGVLLLALAATSVGKKWLETRAAAISVSAIGVLLLVYSFVV
jgi:hypothetical protein